jgi:hypothetical protein
MAYPRWCEGCAVDFASLPGQGTSAHVTVSAEDGGTPSPWSRDNSGRVLEIGCKLCGAIFRWDYFGPATDGRLGCAVGLRRGSQMEWRPEQGFMPESSYPASFAPHRRAS